jgi:2-polyprenyl-3-methyl-5-hydroxy-6-metoxy-1,4-benzoquinol methylase
MGPRETWDALWEAGKHPDAERLAREVVEEERAERCRRILRYALRLGLRPGEMSAVEVGCGSAIYSCIVARRGYRVTAVDQSPAALARAEERASASGVRLDLQRADALEFAAANAGRFDLAMSFGTVEHFRPPLREEMCKAHCDIVRPGGVVVISVPNVLFLPHEILKALLKLRGKWFLGYEGSFTPWELGGVARRLGLEAAEYHGTDVLGDARRYARDRPGDWTLEEGFPRVGPSGGRG